MSEKFNQQQNCLKVSIVMESGSKKILLVIKYGLIRIYSVLNTAKKGGGEGVFCKMTNSSVKYSLHLCFPIKSR